MKSKAKKFPRPKPTPKAHPHMKPVPFNCVQANFVPQPQVSLTPPDFPHFAVTSLPSKKEMMQLLGFDEERLENALAEMRAYGLLGHVRWDENGEGTGLLLIAD